MVLMGEHRRTQKENSSVVAISTTISPVTEVGNKPGLCGDRPTAKE